jgi:threonylcarbamoyladenosine tRNA methylthiotransferase CDKAL1
MAGSKKKCYVNYLGCEKRKLDAQRVVNYLRANGYGLTSRSADADVVVFLTCAFCTKYENYSVAKLEKIYQQKRAGATFVVGGCLPAINPGRLAPFPDAIQIQARELPVLDTILQAHVPMRDIADPNTTIFDTRDEALPRQVGFKSPAELEYQAAKRGYKIRVDWGCLGNCSYCVTRLAEGHLTSKAEDQVVHEFQQGIDAGFRLFFLTGGDAGAYGIDLGSSIVALLKRILEIPGEYVIHFHDFGVQWLIKYFPALLPVFQSHSEKLGCFCFPVQSGSNRILKLMRRPYTSEEVFKTLMQLKKLVPSIKIGTHFIVGFPGETEDDFQLTTHMLREISFDFVEVYRYKDHDRADSHAFSNKVPRDKILGRNAILDQIFQEKFA